MVLAGLVMAWRLATWPTRRSPLLVNPTTEGVVRPPSSLAITLGSPPSMTATTEFVVPRSIPIIFAIILCLTALVLGFSLNLLPLASHLSHLLSTYLMLRVSVRLQDLNAA